MHLWALDELEEMTLLTDMKSSLLDSGFGMGGRGAVISASDYHYGIAVREGLGRDVRTLSEGTVIPTKTPIILPR